MSVAEASARRRASRQHLLRGILWWVLGLAALAPQLPLALPIHQAVALLLASHGSRHLVAARFPGRRGQLAGRLLRGAGVAATLVLLLVASREALAAALAPGVAAAILGVVAWLQLGHLSPTDPLRRPLRWGAGLLLTGSILAFLAVSNLAPTEVAGLVLAVAAGAAAFVLAPRSPAAWREGRVGPALAWVEDHRGRVAPAVGAAVAYLLFHPLLAARYRFLPLLEWSVALVVVTVGLHEASRRLEDRVVAWPWRSSHRRHEQATVALVDPELRRMRGVFERFLAGDVDPERYAALWSEVLQRAGVPAEDAGPALAELRSHRDGPDPLVTLPWNRDRVEARNLAERQRLHRRLVNLLPSPDQGRGRPTEANP